MADKAPDLNQQIAALRQSATNIQALADKALQNGDFEKAQALSSQAVVLTNELGQLQAARRGKAIQSQDWATLNQHLDALNQQAQATDQQVQTAQANVETVKSIVSIIAKLVVV